MPKETSKKLITAERHSAGTTVLHESPFASIRVPIDTSPIPRDFIDSWIVPFHMATLKGLSALEEPLRGRFGEVDVALIRRMLAYANWRPRSVAAGFAALRGDVELTDEIGRLLLRSDVCIAGAKYCFALASFNNAQSVDYLRSYLDYYLTRIDLWFDQAQAMAALQYLDGLNGTTHAVELRPAWDRFVADKVEWNLERTSAWFSSEMALIDEAGARLRSGAGC